MTHNSSSFKKGSKGGPGRKPGKSNKATILAREAIARFVDGNSAKLQEWLDEVHDRDGPLAAIKCFSDLIEYHVPKLSRTEVTGKEEGPVELVIKWSTEK
jgi:hypothetical protein